MSMNTDFRVAVINLSGNCGKTTVARVLLKMRMPDAELISIETTNADGRESDNGSLVRASQFDRVHTALMSHTSVVLDIGSSNIEQTMQLMRQFEGSYADIDYFVVPVVNDVKQRRDSSRTVHELLKLGVDADKIKVVFNRVGVTEDVIDAFDDMIYALENLGVDYDLDAVIRESQFFPYFERTNMSLDEFKKEVMAVPLEENKKRQNELRRKKDRTKAEEQEFKELMKTISTQHLAISATRNLDEVFRTLFKEEIYDDEPVETENKQAKHSPI